MLLKRFAYDDCHESIDPHPKGEFVRYDDVMKMLEDGKLIPDTVVGFTDYEEGWNAGIDALIKESK